MQLTAEGNSHQEEQSPDYDSFLRDSHLSQEVKGDKTINSSNEHSNNNMSTLPEKVGSLFKKKTPNTPPKALYEDLESAHDSIAHRNASAHATTPSQAYFPTAIDETQLPFSRSSALRESLPRLEDMNASSHEDRNLSPRLPHSTSILAEQRTRISPAEIGVRFPTLSYGPGIERREFSDPTLDCAQSSPSEESRQQPRSLQAEQLAQSSQQAQPEVSVVPLREQGLVATQDVPLQVENISRHLMMSLPEPPAEIIPPSAGQNETEVPILEGQTLAMSRLVTESRNPHFLGPAFPRSDTIANNVESYDAQDHDDSANPLDTYRPREELDALLQTCDVPSEIRDQYEYIELQRYRRASQPPSSSLEVRTSDDIHIGTASAASENCVVSSTTLMNLAWSPAESEVGDVENSQDAENVSSYNVSSASHDEMAQSHSGPSLGTENISSYSNTTNLLRNSASTGSGEGPSLAPEITSSENAGDLHVTIGHRRFRIPPSSIHSLQAGSIPSTNDDEQFSRSDSKPDSESIRDYVRRSLASPLPWNTDESTQSPRPLRGTWSNSRAGDLATDFGPGSSQSTSDLSISGHRDRGGSNRDLSSRFRAPTPPGLFGNNALFENVNSSRPPLIRKNSRLAKAALDAGVRKDSRLGRAMAGPNDEDWQTETDVKSGNEMTGVVPVQGMAGSSLANYSDSGNLSLAPHRNVVPRTAVHPPLHGRYSYSWLVQDDVHTGGRMLLPDYTSSQRSRVPNLNSDVSARVLLTQEHQSSYQHPRPLQQGHSHPMTSSIPRLAPPQALPASGLEYGLGQGSVARAREAIGDTSPRLHIPRRTQSQQRGGVARARKAVGAQLEHIVPSSTWQSTLDGGQSGYTSMPSRSGSFATLNNGTNVMGTLDGAGARKVGSSLADESSLGIGVSSRPAGFENSRMLRKNNGTNGSRSTSPGHRYLRHDTGQSLDTTTTRSSDSQYSSETSNYSNHLHANDPRGDLGLHPLPLNLSLRLTRENLPMDPVASHFCSGNVANSREDSTQRRPVLQQDSHENGNAATRERWSALYKKYLPARGPSTINGRTIPRRSSTRRLSSRRRRSSSESEGRAGVLPAATRASALQSLDVAGHRRRQSRNVRLIGREQQIDPASRTALLTNTEQKAEPETLEAGMQVIGGDSTEERGRALIRTVTDNLRGRPILYNGVIYTNKPPPRSHHSLGLQATIPRVYRPAPSIGPAPLRLIAHAESPHLYQLPLGPSSETLAHQELLSRVWLVPCLIFAPLGLLYGHGFMDGVMRWHTNNEIGNFRHQEKTLILIYSYTVVTLCMVAITVGLYLVL